MRRDEFLHWIEAAADELAGRMLPGSPFPPSLFIEDREGRVQIVPGHPGWLHASVEHVELQAKTWAAACRALGASRVVAVYQGWIEDGAEPGADVQVWGNPELADEEGYVGVLTAQGADAAGTFTAMTYIDRTGNQPVLVEWGHGDPNSTTDPVTETIREAMGWHG